MSYSSRVYRQRNPKVQEESKDKPFFPKQKFSQKGKDSNSFFQPKVADQEKEREVTIPKQGDPLKEKETTIQKKAEDDKKEIKKKAEPGQEKDPDKPKEMTA